MGYCTVQDVRDEGEFACDDGRIQKMITLSGAYIDKMTGQWFEARQKALLLDSPGGQVLPLPVAPIAIDQVSVLGHAWTGYQVDTDPNNPRLLAPSGSRWPTGPGQVSVKGTFGYLEAGATPALISYLAIRLVIRELPLVTDFDGQEVKKRARITSESIDGISYSLSQITAAGAFTGDPELDNIITAYQRPSAWGVV